MSTKYGVKRRRRLHNGLFSFLNEGNFPFQRKTTCNCKAIPLMFRVYLGTDVSWISNSIGDNIKALRTFWTPSLEFMWRYTIRPAFFLVLDLIWQREKKNKTKKKNIYPALQRLRGLQVTLRKTFISSAFGLVFFSSSFTQRRLLKT